MEILEYIGTLFSIRKNVGINTKITHYDYHVKIMAPVSKTHCYPSVYCLIFLSQLYQHAVIGCIPSCSLFQAECGC